MHTLLEFIFARINYHDSQFSYFVHFICTTISRGFIRIISKISFSVKTDLSENCDIHYGIIFRDYLFREFHLRKNFARNYSQEFPSIVKINPYEN